ncbi:MAG TPA: adenylate cyclase, partial [Bosea sp. (in: a-proteobacteria)]|uniref:tetratricopeptide repeat protein n=1 Tax=Bosea sp. (in: a-proteobacteria) TaxID=1871050 RepID=UPI0033802E04|nr:adenylate cyclase [Bosea sp. (in: a-proteobacteria)]
PAASDVGVHVPRSADAYLCVLRFYQYRKVLNQEEHAATRACLEQTTQRYPAYSTAWAMLAYLYLDEDRFALNIRRSGPAATSRAREAAEHAVRLDPANARALQALMTVLFFSREPEAALRAGERALVLNPNDTEVLAEYGSRVAQAGDWSRGAAMMEDALARSPAQTGYYVGLVALAYFMQGRDDQALEWIRRADLKRFSIYHFVAALIFTRSGLEQEAKASAATFLSMRPRFFDNFAGELASRNFNARDRAILTKGAQQSGFPVSILGN